MAINSINIFQYSMKIACESLFWFPPQTFFRKHFAHLASQKIKVFQSPSTPNGTKAPHSKMMQNSARFFIGFLSPILTSLMTSNCSRNLLFCRNFRSNFCQRTKPLIVVIKKFVSLGRSHYHPLLPQPFSCQQNNNLHFRSSNNRMENKRRRGQPTFFSFSPFFFLESSSSLLLLLGFPFSSSKELVE